jgi:flagellar FliL protein
MSEQPEQQPEGAAAPVGPETVRKPLLIAVAVGTFVGGMALGTFGVGPMVAGGAAPEATEAHGDVSNSHGADSTGGTGTLYLIDNMVLNPAGSNGSRFLLVATAVEVSNASLVDAMRTRDAELRDVLSGVLGARTVEQLSDLARRDSLRTEIAAALNQMLKQPRGVRRVYFPQFVVQ